MNPSFEASGFQLETTKDGSPTLKLCTTHESMHHSGGAASETWYIYGDMIAQAAESISQLKICSVGLGLGYVEMASAIVMSKGFSFTLDSFETVPQFKLLFKHWIAQSSDFGSPHKAACDHLLRLKKSTLTTEKVRDRLGSMDFSFHDDVTEATTAKTWNVICFDAFSSKTSAKLWTPEFLKNFLDSHASEQCVFSTYASTRNLKEALQVAGFTLLHRDGFSGKRESTLAVRGETMLRAFQTFSHSR